MSEHDIADRQAQHFISTPLSVAAAANLAARTAADGVSCRLGDASCASAHAATVSRSASGQRSSVHRSLLKLQRQYGNQYVGQVLRQANAGEQGGSMDAIERSIDSARGGGHGMDHSTRSRMETAFGADFSGVRIHTDTRADGLSQSLSARAFTTGRDVFFRQGEYNPGASSGRELLAHELTHVVQQNGDGIRRKMSVSQPGDAHEVEADQMARADPAGACRATPARIAGSRRGRGKKEGPPKRRCGELVAPGGRAKARIAMLPDNNMASTDEAQQW